MNREERLASDLAALRVHLAYLWDQAIRSPEYEAWKIEHAAWWQRKGGTLAKCQELFRVYEASVFRAAYQKAFQDLVDIEKRAKRRTMWV